MDLLCGAQTIKRSDLQSEDGSLNSDFHSLALPPPKERYDYNPKPKKAEYIKLVPIQRIDCNAFGLRDVVLIDENTLMILSASQGVLFFSRPSLRPQKDTLIDDGSISFMRKKRALEAKRKRETEANGGVPPPEILFCEFVHTATMSFQTAVKGIDNLTFSGASGSTSATAGRREPVMIRQFSQQLMLLGYDDGWLQLIQYSEKLLTTDPEKTLQSKAPTLFETAVLAEFHAHYSDVCNDESDEIITPLASSREPSASEKVSSSKKKTAKGPLRDIFDATKCKTFGKDGLVIEFFTLGSDLRLVHWGVRYVSSAVEITKTRTRRSQSLDTNSIPSKAEQLSMKKKEGERKLRGKKKSEEEDIDQPPPVYCEVLKASRVHSESAVVEFLGVSYHN